LLSVLLLKVLWNNLGWPHFFLSDDYGINIICFYISTVCDSWKLNKWQYEMWPISLNL
jgi:hypothetical protein